MPRAKPIKSKRQQRRQDPLGVEMDADASIELQARTKAERRGRTYTEEQGIVAEDDGRASDDEGEEFLSEKLSRKILAEARAQQAEAEAEQRAAATGAAVVVGAPSSGKSVRFGGATTVSSDATAAAAARGGGVRVSLRSEHSDEDDDDVGAGDDDVVLGEDGEYVEIHCDDADEALVRRFMTSDFGGRRTLADLISGKLQEKEKQQDGGSGMDVDGGDEEDGPGSNLDPKIVHVYGEVAKFLKRYKSGKLPKVFKILPGLSNWEELLYLTRPEEWTPHAVYAATRIFASNLDPTRAQRFFNNILLSAVRDDISENKKLNYHLYMALKKACYKPAAFYKGIVLPLCLSGNCTLKEGKVVSSVIKKVSLPQIHSAAALLKLAQMRYSGAQSLFMATLINKKYALPYRVVDSLVDHFVSFVSVEGPLPVIWHQSLLALAQRYKQNLTREQKLKLKPVLKKHHHYAITAEVRRELYTSTSRGE